MQSLVFIEPPKVYDYLTLKQKAEAMVEVESMQFFSLYVYWRRKRVLSYPLDYLVEKALEFADTADKYLALCNLFKAIDKELLDTLCFEYIKKVELKGERGEYFRNNQYPYSWIISCASIETKFKKEALEFLSSMDSSVSTLGDCDEYYPKKYLIQKALEFSTNENRYFAICNLFNLLDKKLALDFIKAK